MDGTGPGLAKGPKKGQWDGGMVWDLAGLVSGLNTGAGGGGLVRLRGNWPKSALGALSRAGLGQEYCGLCRRQSWSVDPRLGFDGAKSWSWLVCVVRGKFRQLVSSLDVVLGQGVD